MFEKILTAILALFKGHVSALEVAIELDKIAKQSSTPLDWRHSVVDLLKVLKLDSSFEARQRLYGEFGRSPLSYTGSAEENTWLHGEIMKRIAANGFKL